MYVAGTKTSIECMGVS